jgi:DNA-binding transcriptional LysR family regulator
MKTKMDYYRIFYETARHSSFSTAASHLYISQSAISQCIHQLEQDLNVKLFNRTRRGVTLTDEGRVLFEKIEVAMQAIDQGETLLERRQRLESGSLVIAAGDAITSHYLLPYLEEFHATYPHIRIEMANSYSSDLLQRTKKGKVELAFINLPVTDNDLTVVPCLTIHDIFVCGSEQTINSRYTWEEMAQEPLILLEQKSNSRQFLDQKFSEKGIHLTPQIELAVYDLLIRFASIHLGVSCVIKEFSEELLEKKMLQIMNLSPPLPARQIGYAHLKNQPLSLAAQAFIQLLNK